ncbi:LLM class flavin-dependent oxidoreductase [Kocuria rhizophila]|uniref:Alkanesulfonate monooxygenase n=1 Tax=Kocuria rhizophila (strain ATCC 9341 / DSM 348 / NBRC 103217 / DC2201) TaxID=378753 RepID=B2GKL2_KOCRD|nr:LLM class flavin-dependent oxidoreductase [Kocuria rhizophila]ASE11463.1 LLM class flavin-dependent oxidoreductase [Kocuria rhizophila]BAG28503.1 alkanesulfonate monooxygenase [Kocuria rhizophila DC2201]VEH76192.1 Alkanesulfonate monooxygenase [Kocuria rhizophila]
MSPISLHWFLPTASDSRGIVGGGHGASIQATQTLRGPRLPYLVQVAQAAEYNGFESVLSPTGLWCQDAWLTTAAISQHTERLKFLVALRPGAMSPTLAAQMAATYQDLTGGRLNVNVVAGGESTEQRAFGDFLDKDGRYARTGEFLDIVSRLWDHESPFDYRGEHLAVEQARLDFPPAPRPQVYFGGSSAAAATVAAEHADVFLTWGEPPQQAKEKIDRIRELARARGRSVRFGIRLHTISRETSAQAWAVAEGMLAGVDERMIQEQQEALRRSESEGQRRMLDLHGGSATKLQVHPGLWAGVGLLRGGAGTAMVGSHREVADLIAEYVAAGIDEFVLSGYPCLEEAYWFGEGVRPLLQADGLL